MRSGTIALAAVLAFTAMAVFVGIVGMGGSSASHPVAAPLKAPHAAFHEAPAAGNATASVALTSTPPLYIQLPYTISFTVTVSNVVWTTLNGSLNVQIRDVASICQGGLGLSLQCPAVVNISLNSSLKNGVSDYSTTITTTNLTAPQFRESCPAGGPPCTYDNGIFPNDQYQIFVFASANNSFSADTGVAEQTGYLITSNPTASLLAPTAGNSVSTGNVSVAISYGGSYVTGASIAIYPGSTSTGSPVYTQSLFAPGAGTQTVVAAAPWAVATSGAYLAVINVTTPYSTTFFSTSLTVVSAGGGIVYVNTTQYQNTTGGGGGKIFGLTTQVGGTVLLVAGLIIGMIVAFMLGMMMWGGAPKSGSPAQPWQSKPTNECSVCHQTFPTEQELKDHAKSAHGMS